MIADSWRLDDLSQKIQVPPSVVRKKMAYWQAQGLIEETSTDQFTLIENIEQHARQESGIHRLQSLISNTLLYVCWTFFW